MGSVTPNTGSTTPNTSSTTPDTSTLAAKKVGGGGGGGGGISELAEELAQIDPLTGVPYGQESASDITKAVAGPAGTTGTTTTGTTTGTGATEVARKRGRKALRTMLPVPPHVITPITNDPTTGSGGVKGVTGIGK